MKYLYTESNGSEIIHKEVIEADSLDAAWELADMMADGHDLDIDVTLLDNCL